VPDACNAGVVSELFSRFATGKYSLDAIIGELRAEGVTLRGRRLQKSTVHQVLRKRLYMGDFDFDGVTYQGTHEPLVTRECWQRVQELLNARCGEQDPEGEA